ncbi:MAG: PQQ-dependent sugar dehydrogenase, partial [Alphaproteobacteria bacterium]
MSIFLQALFFKSKITTWIMAVLFFGMMQHGAASDFAKYTQIGDNIAHPWGMDYLNDQMMLVTGREDGLFSINMTDDTTRQIGGLPRDVMVGGQGGWLDILVDSRQNQHNRIYLCYSRQGQNPRTASTAVLTGIINQDQLEQIDMIFTANNPSKARNHYGCRLALIKDHLYVSVGDRTQRDLAQDVAAHAGSVIEIDLPVDSAFRPDLPSRVFSKGHRNPQGMIY